MMLTFTGHFLSVIYSSELLEEVRPVHSPTLQRRKLRLKKIVSLGTQLLSGRSRLQSQIFPLAKLPTSSLALSKG